MASIKVGSIIADIRGKVGDQVYSRNRAGLYVKATYNPVQTSYYWSVAKDYFILASAAWSTLSDSDFIAWRNFTEQFGKVSSFIDGHKSLDPRDFYIACSMNRQYCGLDEFPQPVEPGNPGFTHLSVDISSSSNIDLQVHGGSYSEDYYTIFKSCPPRPLTTRSINTVYQSIFHTSFYNPDTSNEVYTEFYDRFSVGAPDDTQRGFFSCNIIHGASGVQVGWNWTSSIGVTLSNYYYLGDQNIYGNVATATLQAAVRVLASQSSFMQSISWYLDNPTGSYRFALYSDASGVPDAKLCESNVFSPGSGIFWRTENVTPAFNIINGNYYWIAIGSSGQSRNRYGSAGNPVSFGSSSGTTFPSNWSQSATAALQVSAYATALY